MNMSNTSVSKLLQNTAAAITIVAVLSTFIAFVFVAGGRYWKFIDDQNEIKTLVESVNTNMESINKTLADIAEHLEVPSDDGSNEAAQFKDFKEKPSLSRFAAKPVDDNANLANNKVYKVEFRDTLPSYEFPS